MELDGYLRQFARIAMTGLNLQPGQSLAIKAEPENLNAAVRVAEEAYRCGARYVDLWADSSRIARARLDHSGEEYLDAVPAYHIERNREFIEDHWALLSIKSPVDPSIMEGVDAARVGTVTAAIRAANAPRRRALANDETQWTVMAVPAPGWAGAVFNADPGPGALQRLWEALVPILRLDEENPAEYWKHHGRFLKERAGTLDSLQIRSLRFRADGTDLVVPLHERARWLGGGSETRAGIPFLPNVPTEEVFSAPFAPGVEGLVRVTKPVRVYGSLVEGAWFRFERGAVTDFGADTSADMLGAFLDVDEGSRRMGEIALVDDTSPIARSGLVFQNILLDENASCHFALGAAYPTCLEGGDTMDDPQLDELGANISNQHLDFMIGSTSMDIDAATADERDVAIMRQGRFLL